MSENEISTAIIGACIRIHKALGPGLFESTYEKCLVYELQALGLKVETQKPIPLTYGDLKIDEGYRIDILVEGKVLIELKSVQHLQEIHWSQVLTYLRLGNYKLGLLINFNEVLVKDGIHRIVNRL